MVATADSIFEGKWDPDTVDLGLAKSYRCLEVLRDATALATRFVEPFRSSAEISTTFSTFNTNPVDRSTHFSLNHDMLAAYIGAEEVKLECSVSRLCARID